MFCFKFDLILWEKRNKIKTTIGPHYAKSRWYWSALLYICSYRWRVPYNRCNKNKIKNNLDCYFHKLFDFKIIFREKRTRIVKAYWLAYRLYLLMWAFAIGSCQISNKLCEHSEYVETFLNSLYTVTLPTHSYSASYVSLKVTLDFFRWEIFIWFIFSASVVFMIWSLVRHRFVNCLKVSKNAKLLNYLKVLRFKKSLNLK